MSSSPLLVSRTSSYLEWIEEAHALFNNTKVVKRKVKRSNTSQTNETPAEF
jgi:hypothetical protein